MKKKYLSVFSNLKMKTKLMLLYFPITILSLTVVGVLAYAISSNAVEDQSLKIIRQAQHQVCTEISSRISGYESTLESFCLDTNKNRTLKGNFYQAYDEKINMQSTISNIYSVMASLGIHSNITMVRAKSTGSEAIGKNFHNLLPGMPDITGSMSGTAVQIINLERIQDRPWMKPVMEEKNECIWMQIENDEQYGYYSVIKWSSGEVANSYNGFYIMTLRIEDILQIDPLSASQQTYSYLILDQNGKLIYSDEKESSFYSNCKEEIEKFCADKQNMISIKEKVLLKEEIPQNGWTVISLVSLGELNRQTVMIGMVVLISCICAGFYL